MTIARWPYQNSPRRYALWTPPYTPRLIRRDRLRILLGAVLQAVFVTVLAVAWMPSVAFSFLFAYIIVMIVSLIRLPPSRREQLFALAPPDNDPADALTN